MKQMYLVFILCAAAADVHAVDMVYNTFTNTGIRITSRGPSRQVASVIKCAALCGQSTQTCLSFVYNKTTGDCSPGSLVIEPSNPSDVVISGELYYGKGSPCDNGLANFTLRQNGSISICLWVSTFETDYTSATAQCAGLGSHLYTTKVPEKLNILLDELKNVFMDYWIGLNDIAEEGVFRWVDDNSSFNISWPFWGANEPDNMENEDCVQYKWDIFPFNDARCTFSCRFVCEFNLLL